MTTWENLAYHGQLYVKVAFARALQPFAPTQPVPIYYAITPNSLVVTPSEPVLKRALDRAQAQGGHTDWASSNAPPAGGFLGTNLCLRLDGDLLPAIGALLRNRLQQTHQRLAWGNLPILNEWRRRYPALAPAQVQERFWPTDLLRPGGDDYVWDEQWQTMESTVYGHPAQPKPGQAPPRGPAGIIAAELGLTCENGGLSAKLVLERPGLP